MVELERYNWVGLDVITRERRPDLSFPLPCHDRSSKLPTYTTFCCRVLEHLFLYVWTPCSLYDDSLYNVSCVWTPCLLYNDSLYNVSCVWTPCLLYNDSLYNVSCVWTPCLLYNDSLYNVSCVWTPCLLYNDSLYNVSLYNVSG